MFALLLTLAAVGGSAPLRGAAFSTDQSDLWWNPDESGWGIQYVHTGNAIFATMLVYGPTDQPTWYIATLEPQPSSDTWSGALLATSGPWFGTVPFDSALVKERTAGTMTWSALSTESGLLTYSIDGVAVSKTIYRQPLWRDTFAGEFPGIIEMTICGVTGQWWGVPVLIKAIQEEGKLTVTAPIGALDKMGLTVCTFAGDYTQLGHLGRSRGSFTCDDGSQGEHTFTEVTVRKLGWMPLWSALLTARYSSGCTMTAILR
jgi:hypothetical protein